MKNFIKSSLQWHVKEKKTVQTNSQAFFICIKDLTKFYFLVQSLRRTNKSCIYFYKSVPIFPKAKGKDIIYIDVQLIPINTPTFRPAAFFKVKNLQ